MYTLPQFAETRIAVLHDLIRAYPLATFVSFWGDELAVNHFPLYLMAGKTGGDVLQGHIPRGNVIWEAFDDREAIAVFQGPQAYITPSWYPGKQHHGKVVPTWNYAVVQVHGRPRAVHEGEWLLRHLTMLTDQQEREQGAPWRVSDAPAAFVDQLVGSLVGIELPVSSISGKWKVSQNRPVADRKGVAAGLNARGDDQALAMEALVGAHISGEEAGQEEAG